MVVHNIFIWFKVRVVDVMFSRGGSIAVMSLLWIVFCFGCGCGCGSSSSSSSNSREIFCIFLMICCSWVLVRDKVMDGSKYSR